MQPVMKKRQRHQPENFLFVLMGLILLGLLISGYFLFVDKILPSLTGTPATSTSAGTVTTGGNAQAAGSASSETLIPEGEGMAVTLYFGVRGADHLTREVRKIPEQKMLLNQATELVRELLKGPFTPEARAVIPAGTTLRSLFYSQGTFFVDLSKEFVEAHPGGPTEEALTLYSIVNTLTELDRKARVRFLVNGLEIDTLKGHIGLKNSLSRYEAILMSAKGS
ncbi:MAG TPA: GerMN domain-containing protein [Candidatus Ozemobacteraceae bacterium]